MTTDKDEAAEFVRQLMVWLNAPQRHLDDETHKGIIETLAAKHIEAIRANARAEAARERRKARVGLWMFYFGGFSLVASTLLNVERLYTLVLP